LAVHRRMAADVAHWITAGRRKFDG
jgi:hypothetical protein